MYAEKLAAICDSLVMVTCFSTQHNTGTVPQSSERGLTISAGPTPSQATCTIYTYTPSLTYYLQHGLCPSPVNVDWPSALFLPHHQQTIAEQWFLADADHSQSQSPLKPSYNGQSLNTDFFLVPTEFLVMSMYNTVKTNSVVQTFVYYRPVCQSQHKRQCWIQQTDWDHHLCRRSYWTVTAIWLIKRLLSRRDYVIMLDTNRFYYAAVGKINWYGR